MSALYIDNFRGFFKTYIPLKKVNFFVGENSTGKSSLLKLIKALSSPSFWRYEPFINDDTKDEIGTFSEIISVGSLNKNYFEIGISDLSESGQFYGIKLKFIDDFYNNSKLPILKEVSVINERFHLQSVIDGNILRYRFGNLQFDSANESPLSLFKYWINSNELNEKIFNRTTIDFVGIVPIINQINRLVSNANGPDVSNRMPFEIILPGFFNRLAAFSPIRFEPQKNYASPSVVFEPSGRHTPYVLSRIYDNEDVQYILKRFGEDSGLYDEIMIQKLRDNDSESPFEILFRLNNKWLNIVNVGYGVSQILPIIVEIIARPENSFFALQQPEIHLHPRAQAALGDFIYKANVRDSTCFIIETHSDYLIDRFRIRVHRASLENAPVEVLRELGQVIFFSRTIEGNVIRLIDIEIDGSYSDDQPEEFRDFFIHEQLNLIKIT